MPVGIPSADSVSKRTKQVKPFAFAPADFQEYTGICEYVITTASLFNVDLLAHYYMAGIHLPQGAMITAFTLYGWRNDALASLVLQLQANDMAGGDPIIIDTATADWMGGSGSIEAVLDPPYRVDNAVRNMSFALTIDANDHASMDVYFIGAKIDWF